MARIKTALEIALERTESVKSNRGSIDQFDAKQRGKKLAGMFLAKADGAATSPADSPDVDLAKEIKSAPQDQQKSLKQGVFEMLLSQISLPASKEDEKRIEAVGAGLKAIITHKQFASLYSQFFAAVSKFQSDSAKYDEAIRSQYAPKLRQKEEELSRRLGTHVRIDPFKDPDFVNFYTQNMNALKEKYQAIVEEVREEVMRMFEE